MLPLILSIGLLGGGAYLVKRKLDKTNHGVLTPARELVYKAMMGAQHDVNKIREVAAAFERQGLKKYAERLYRKADSADAPPEVKEARKETFRKAMSSVNVAAIEKVADAFEEEGIQVSAEKLREYARGLRAKEKITTTESPIPEHLPDAPVPDATTPGPHQVANPHKAANGIATGVNTEQHETLEPGTA